MFIKELIGMHAVLLKSVVVFRGLPVEELPLFIKAGTSIELTGQEGVAIFDESELYETCRGQMCCGIEAKVFDPAHHLQHTVMVPLNFVCLL